MVLNSDINVYGRESKPGSFSSKSKGEKTYGLKFPIGDTDSGDYLKKSSGIGLVKSNLRQLLLTRRGERVMLPLFGTNLKNYLMEPLDQALLSQIRREILESIYLYAPNVTVSKIMIFPLTEDALQGGHSLRIELYCALKENEDIGFEVEVELR